MPSTESLFLSKETKMNMASDAKTSHDAIVGVKAKENPMMDLIAPGDPDHSYLWIKVSGDPNKNATASAGCAMVATCTGCSATTPCGAQMPYNATPLNSDQLCTLKSWIVQGANNN
jgi:hypothetical protein